ncbi:MAG: nucleotidyltransferase family protein [Terracidiphilus sp.]|jgi:hypothetical protein
MIERDWIHRASPAFRLAIATSWLAPDPWRENQENAIREAIEAQPDWTEYLHLVDRHGTPGLSWAALRRIQGIAVPEPPAQELRRRSDACRKEALLYCLLLADVLRRFNGAGIPAMPHKGQVLSFELYGDVGLRYSRDLDVEVPIEDLDRARTLIAGEEWRLESTFFPMSPRQWQSLLKNEQHINFVHARTGAPLELHWRFQWETSSSTEARWDRSIPALWQGYSIHSMHPADMALFLCSHGGLHAWFRAKWLGDLARAHSLGLLDWEASFNRARESGQARVLLAALQLLEQVYGLSIPKLSTEHLPAQLIEFPLRALGDANEPQSRVGPAKLRNRVRLSRHERLLWPHKSLWTTLSELFYGREDFRTLRLPDCLFWAYTPLRPILWMWRWARRRGRSGTEDVRFSYTEH